jgi:uncharacterized Ntn-hydrolase superfamily protein
MTYSITACDAGAGQLGIAVQTHFPAAGAVVPWARPGIGAIATQGLVRVEFGPLGLNLLEQGAGAQSALNSLLDGDRDSERRQLAIIRTSGDVAVHTGSRCVAYADHRIGPDYSVQANMMKRPGAPDAMAEAFGAASGSLLERMLAALQAAEATGGDVRGPQSAAARVVASDAATDPDGAICDLRVDLDADPLRRLGDLVNQHEAQILDRTAHKHAAIGEVEKALDMFRAARERAPDASEMQFWQAVGLVTKYGQSAQGRRLFAGLVAEQPQWRDLLARMLEQCWFDNPEAIKQVLGAE